MRNPCCKLNEYDVTGWLNLPRVPEPEIMDDSGAVQAYSSAAAQLYLSQLDDTFVAHALRLVAPRRDFGRGLDIGTGPGQIVWKLARRLSGWHLVGVDRSPTMIRQALAEGDVPGGETSCRVQFLQADGGHLPFADASIDLVLCNSVLHHLERSARLLAEIKRVANPAGAILVRDLRRPSRLAFPMHVRWYGRHYRGLMYKLYCDSVRAAYTLDELSGMLHESPVTGTRLFTVGQTHLGFERPAQTLPL